MSKPYRNPILEELSRCQEEIQRVTTASRDDILHIIVAFVIVTIGIVLATLGTILMITEITPLKAWEIALPFGLFLVGLGLWQLQVKPRNSS